MDGSVLESLIPYWRQWDLKEEGPSWRQLGHGSKVLDMGSLASLEVGQVSWQLGAIQ